MKKLDIKAFYTIMTGIIATLVCRIFDLAISKNREFPRLEKRFSEEQLTRLATALFRLNFLVTLAFAIICVYFIYRLIKNSKEPQGQGYITFLFILNIIILVFNVFLFALGNFLYLISIAINVAIIVGCTIQRNSENIEKTT